MSRYHTITIELEVHDATALLAAAKERATADGAPIDGLTGADGEPDTAACLVMLLDPGSLAGCSIEHSSAEEIDL